MLLEGDGSGRSSGECRLILQGNAVFDRKARDTIAANPSSLGGMPMFWPVIFVGMAIWLLPPTQAFPQQTSSVTAISTQPEEPSGVSQLQPGAGLDTQFKALLQARDQEVAVNNELRRVDFRRQFPLANAE